jgi:periplasmic protein TonB
VFQPRPVPAVPFVERVRILAGRRTLGLGLAFLIEALILLLLLTLGRIGQPGVKADHPTVVTLIPAEQMQDAPEPQRPEPERQAAARPQTQSPAPQQPQPPQPAAPPTTPAPQAPPAVPTTPAFTPMRWQLAPSATPPPAAPARPVYGPPDNRSAFFRDTERVGTAPNGEPLYAAEWYREPAADMMRAYLSTAHGPGWGLIACRTAPEYRVEDCVALEEYPQGSQINRSALAAAWEFKVRPPRRGGRPLVGAWVRIRIEYGLR